MRKIAITDCIENDLQNWNAGPKARGDVKKILRECGFHMEICPCGYWQMKGLRFRIEKIKSAFDRKWLRFWRTLPDYSVFFFSGLWRLTKGIPG